MAPLRLLSLSQSILTLTGHSLSGKKQLFLYNIEEEQIQSSHCGTLVSLLYPGPFQNGDQISSEEGTLTLMMLGEDSTSSKLSTPSSPMWNELQQRKINLLSHSKDHSWYICKVFSMTAKQERTIQRHL